MDEPLPAAQAEPNPDRAQDPVSAQLRGLLDELAGAPERDLREAWLSGLREGALVGRFELLRELGRGGFGVVYEARDRELGRLVAFKAVRPGNRSVSEMREQWLKREAEAAAQLHHPNIVTLHDAGKSEHGPYLIFELLEGETLAERLARGPLPVREAVAVAAEVARGLSHAHAAGVIHRDLKPSNVFLTGGGVKVLDFGLAHVFGASGLRGGGTPVYMAPEQWRQEPDDERVDVFALGTMLYQSIAGETPFRLVNDRSTCLDPAPAPRLDRLDVPAPLADLVAAMLSKDPAGRPRTGQAALARLAEVEAALGPADSQPPVPLQPPRWWRRRAARWAAAAVAAAVAAAIGWLIASRPPPGRIPVVVADFHNETGEADLERLSGMLITSLEQSRRLAVPTRGRMLDVAAQVTGARPEVIDETLGREIARRLGAAAVSLASVRRFGSVYAIDVQVLDPRRNEYLLAAREQGSKEEVPAMLDRLSERMRAGLRERASEIRATRVDLARATTANLEAWQHFVRGEELFGLQEVSEEPAWPAAREEYRRAVALAPDFVMAHYRIAYTLRYEGLVERAREALRPALALVDRTSPKERAYVLALSARIEGKPAEALRQYRAILADYPEEKDAWYAMAQISATSRELGYDHAHAIEYARKALALKPDFAPAWEQLLVSLFARAEDAALLAEAQRYAETVTSASSLESLGHAQLVAGRDADAEKTFQHLAKAMPGSPAGLLGLGLARLQRLDLAGAEEAYRRLAGAPDARRAREGHYGLSWVSAFRGRFREASMRIDEVIRLDERIDRADLSRAYGQKVLWTALGRGGLPEDLVRRGQALVDPAAEPYVDHRHFYWFAIYAALATGRLDRAQALHQEGLAVGSTHSRPLLQAAVARARGRAEDFKAAVTRLYSPRDLSRALAFHAAEWALQDGRAEEAVAGATASMALPIYPPHQDVAGFRAALWPRSLLLRARAYAAAGNRGAAEADLGRLLALWRDADRDAPDVARARALRAELAHRAR